MEKRANNYRYERKFLIENGIRNAQEIESILKFNIPLIEIYETRQVNNIYLDDPFFSDFSANVVGAEHRRKIRIRWYGETFGIIKKPVLEIKIKQGHIGDKISFPLNTFVLDENFSKTSLLNILEQSNLPINIYDELKGCDIALLNSYKRQYFLSFNQKFRLTLDSNLVFYRLNNIGNHFLQKFETLNSVILEMKYNVENEATANNITNVLPCRMTKNSKYVTGMKHLNFSF